MVVVPGIPACGAVFCGNSWVWLMAGTYIHYEVSECRINKSKEFRSAHLSALCHQRRVVHTVCDCCSRAGS